jgi:hypothetical protein
VCAEASTVLRVVAADFFSVTVSVWRSIRIRTKVRPLSFSKLSIGSVLEFLCWKWKPYLTVIFRKYRLV